VDESMLDPIQWPRLFVELEMSIIGPHTLYGKVCN
jgi:hypothetical protein